MSRRNTSRQLSTDATHYVEWDAPGRRVARAICGLYVRLVEHTLTPTCPRCRALVAARMQEAVDDEVQS